MAAAATEGAGRAEAAVTGEVVKARVTVAAARVAGKKAKEGVERVVARVLEKAKARVVAEEKH